MGWNLVAPNTWKNDRSNYVIEYDPDYSQYVIRSMDNNYIVPFDDIFNNPVFPVDFSQVTVLGKHFRAEGTNSPGTPGFSFQGDTNTGFYRVSEDVIGISSGGNKVSEINNFGALNGIPGTDRRNLIKYQSGLFTTGTPGATSTSILSTGIGFSYTPLRSDSLLKIRFYASILTSYGSLTSNTGNGLVYIYRHTSIPTAGTSASGTQLAQFLAGYTGTNSTYFWATQSHQHLYLESLSADINSRFYYLAFSVSAPNSNITIYATAQIIAGYTIEEFI